MSKIPVDPKTDTRTRDERIQGARAHNHTLRDRQTAANQRAADRSKLDAFQQLEALDWRLGVGAGAKRERARLAKSL